MFQQLDRPAFCWQACTSSGRPAAKHCMTSGSYTAMPLMQQDNPLVCSRGLQNYQSRQACHCSAALRACHSTRSTALHPQISPPAAVNVQHAGAVRRQAAAPKASSLQRPLLTSYGAL